MNRLAKQYTASDESVDIELEGEQEDSDFAQANIPEKKKPEIPARYKVAMRSDIYNDEKFQLPETVSDDS